MRTHPVGSWSCSRISLPVFSNGDCALPGFIHSEDCRAACTIDGFPSERRCLCGAAVRSLPAWTAVRLHLVSEMGLLVTQVDSGPFWIERGHMEKTSGPPRRLEPRAAPPDFLAIELALALGTAKAGRRKRVPEGAEIVFVRADLRNGKEITPWRLLCEVMRPEGLCVLLIDPSLSTERALTSGWLQQRLIALVLDGKQVERNRVLVPAFPLGDVVDPGWK